MRIQTTLLLALSVLAFAGSSTATSLPWVNGDFGLGDATWTFPAATRIADFEGDGDMEAVLQGAGDGTWQLSRGVTKGVVSARTYLEFDVEQGSLETYSIRMILLRLDNASAYANNLYYNDPTGTLQPDWFDDQVLDWHGVSLRGHVLLDPAQADAYNIPGWSGMSAGARQAHLAMYTHMTMVIYGYASPGGATLDDFAWNLHPL